MDTFPLTPQFLRGHEPVISSDMLEIAQQLKPAYFSLASASLGCGWSHYFIYSKSISHRGGGAIIFQERTRVASLKKASLDPSIRATIHFKGSVFAKLLEKVVLD